MSRTVDALAAAHRTIVYSLAGEPGTQANGTSSPTLDDLARQLAGVLDERGVSRAVVCGVSFGGLVALHFAAQYPERTRALVLASVPGPGWHLRPSHRAYVRSPWLAAPLFFAGMPARLRREIYTALPERRQRRSFLLGLLPLVFRAPVSPARMAGRARLIDGIDNLVDCRRVSAPTLVVTGEPELDHVVPVDGSASYAALIPTAKAVTLDATGHLGPVTRPDRFASVVTSFLREVGIEQAA
jgi:pimeloyl-ACP methyl ester carboxylesterase